MDYFREKNIIHPADSREIGRWSSKWGVSPQQLIRAIIETGSIEVKRLKAHLFSKGKLRRAEGWKRFFQRI